MLTRRKFMKAVGLSGAAVSLGGISLSRAQTPLKRVVIGQGVDLPSLDPYGHSVQLNYAMWRHIIEPLIKYDAVNRKYYGALAESWKGEGTEWTFKLKKGIKFHNGYDFTARDVAFSIDSILNSKQAHNLKPIVTGARVVDDFTVKITTSIPFSPLLGRLKDAMMVSHQVYREMGEKAIQNPIGTGQFKFIEWVRGSHFVVGKNEKFWGKPAEIDQIIWKPIPEDAARVTAVESGGADLVTNIPPHEADRINKNPNLRVERVMSMRMIHIALSPRFKPFQNRSVRLAMNYAVDIDSIIKHVIEGQAHRARGFSGPTVIGYNPDIKPRPYDPAKAKSLLAEAGYPNGFEVDFYFPTGRYLKDREVSQAIAAQLANVGVKTKSSSPEWSVFWSGVLEGKYPMYLFGGFNLEDPDLMVSLYFETGITKRIGYSNPEVDKLLKEQRQTFDTAKRERILRDIFKIVHEDAPTIPLYHPEDLYGVARKVVWKASPDEEISMYDASLKG